MGEEFGNPMVWDGLTPMQSVPHSQLTLPEPGANLRPTSVGPEIGDPYQTRQRAEDAMYASAASRLAPQYDSKRQALEIKLRNMGIGPEDESWRSQMADLDRQEVDAYNQATWSAVGEGRNESGQMFDQMMDRSNTVFGQNLGANQQNFGQELDRSNTLFGQALASNQQNFGQNMAGANYSAAIRQQQIAEEMQKRGFSLNEINALLYGQQVGMPQMPGFNQAQAAQPAPIYQGAADEASLDAAMSPWNALIGMAGTLGGGFLAGRNG